MRTARCSGRLGGGGGGVCLEKGVSVKGRGCLTGGVCLGGGVSA